MKVSTLVILATLGMALTNAHAAPETYQLKCRGGADLEFVLTVEGDFRVTFKKSPNAAGPSGSGLRPSECAWTDRALNAQEPNSFTVQVGPKFLVGAVMLHRTNPSQKAYFYAFKQKWVYDFQTLDMILTINAYNNGSTLVVPNP